MSNSVKAGSWFTRFEAVGTISGGPPIVQDQPVAASQTLLKGDPVTSSGGELTKGAANSGAIYGVTVEAVTTTVADEKTVCKVAVASRHNIFRGQADAATNAIHEGEECDIIASGSKWLVDIGASTEDVVLIKKKTEGDDEADSTDPGRIDFVWKRSQYDALVAAR